MAGRLRSALAASSACRPCSREQPRQRARSHSARANPAPPYSLGPLALPTAGPPPEDHGDNGAATR